MRRSTETVRALPAARSKPADEGQRPTGLVAMADYKSPWTRWRGRQRVDR